MNVALLMDGPLAGALRIGPAGSPIIESVSGERIEYRWRRGSAYVNTAGQTIRHYYQQRGA